MRRIFTFTALTALTLSACGGGEETSPAVVTVDDTPVATVEVEETTTTVSDLPEISIPVEQVDTTAHLMAEATSRNLDVLAMMNQISPQDYADRNFDALIDEFETEGVSISYDGAVFVFTYESTSVVLDPADVIDGRSTVS